MSFESRLWLVRHAPVDGPRGVIHAPDAPADLSDCQRLEAVRAQLEQPAELRLIVSSVQVLAEGHGFERWGNLPSERARLLDLIAKTGARGVVFLSGDRHIGALYRRPSAPYDLYEITSSGINMTYATNRDAGPFRLGAVYGAENFGTIGATNPCASKSASYAKAVSTPTRRMKAKLTWSTRDASPTPARCAACPSRCNDSSTHVTSMTGRIASVKAAAAAAPRRRRATASASTTT